MVKQAGAFSVVGLPLRVRWRHVLIALAFGFVVNVLVIVLDWAFVDIGAVSRKNTVAVTWDRGPSDTLFVHEDFHVEELALSAYSFVVFRRTTEQEIAKFRGYGYRDSKIEPAWVEQELSRVLSPNSKAWATNALYVVIVGNGWPKTCFVGAYAGIIEWQVIPNSHRETTASGAILQTNQNIHRLAYYPLFSSLALNTLFYGLPSLLVVVMFLAVRFVLRAKRNRCGWCAHQLIAENGGRCPECGNVSHLHFGYVSAAIDSAN